MNTKDLVAKGVERATQRAHDTEKKALALNIDGKFRDRLTAIGTVLPNTGRMGPATGAAVFILETFIDQVEKDLGIFTDELTDGMDEDIPADAE